MRMVLSHGSRGRICLVALILPLLAYVLGAGRAAGDDGSRSMESSRRTASQLTVSASGPQDQDVQVASICDSLGRGHAQKILGGSLDIEPQPIQDRAGSITCSFERVNGGSVTVIVVTLLTRPMSKKRFASLASSNEVGVVPKRVRRLGGMAFWESHPAEPHIGVLSLWLDGPALIVQVVNEKRGPQDVRSDAISIAREIGLAKDRDRNEGGGRFSPSSAP